MLRGQPCGQEVCWWALQIIMYAMMARRFPFSDPDKYRLQHYIKQREVKYQTGISKEAELMRRVSIVNIKTEALHVLEYCYHVLYFPWTCPLLGSQNFRPCLTILWDVKYFLTLCSFLNCPHNVMGFKCKNFTRTY